MSAHADRTDARRERIAIIDLGPSPDPAIRASLSEAAVAAGLAPVTEDFAELALSGVAVERDALALEAADARAAAEFAKLDCAKAIEAATTVIGISAQRQAARRATPELARAWNYVLLCADRSGARDRAAAAAAALRALGGGADLPPDLAIKYPDVDAVVGGELVPVTIEVDAPGAEVWVDFRPIGIAPVTAWLSGGEHVVAAATKQRRGWASGTATPTQPKLTIATEDYLASWSDVADKVASWNGKLPTPAELGWVLAKVRARVTVIRRGDTIEAFGRTGLAEVPHRLGADNDGSGPLTDARRIMSLIGERTTAWNSRAPDPDRPLLRESDGERRAQPTKWWVYASILGAVVAGGLVIYSQDAGSNRQRIELVVP